ncbi:hypothetical protein FB106_109113 [Synechococcus sp. Ace-Pa]|nr:hypothetical protein FB106_109113 [Synechococcus sp. Ace-Pa]
MPHHQGTLGQAVRLPKDYRFFGTEVLVKSFGNLIRQQAPQAALLGPRLVRIYQSSLPWL